MAGRKTGNQSRKGPGGRKSGVQCTNCWAGGDEFKRGSLLSAWAVAIRFQRGGFCLYQKQGGQAGRCHSSLVNMCSRTCVHIPANRRLYVLRGIALGLRKTGWSARPAQADTEPDLTMSTATTAQTQRMMASRPGCPPPAWFARRATPHIMTTTEEPLCVNPPSLSQGIHPPSGLA